MTQILTMIVEQDQEGRVAVNWFESDGLTSQLALAAVQAVERELQRRVVRAELEAEQKEREE